MCLHVCYCVVVSSRSSSAGSGHRPLLSVCGNDGRMTPLRATPTSENGSGGSNLSERIDAVSNSINLMDIDTVVQHIRQVFQYNNIMSVCIYRQCINMEFDHNYCCMEKFHNEH